MVCCAFTWVALNYKLHCNRFNVAHRLDGVVSEALELRTEFNGVTKIQQYVLELTGPRFGTKRIVNMGTYYSTMQLLSEMDLNGLYGQRTTKSKDKRFPQHPILGESKCARGDHCQAISSDFSMIEAS